MSVEFTVPKYESNKVEAKFLFPQKSEWKVPDWEKINPRSSTRKVGVFFLPERCLFTKIVKRLFSFMRIIGLLTAEETLVYPQIPA